MQFTSNDAAVLAISLFIAQSAECSMLVPTKWRQRVRESGVKNKKWSPRGKQSEVKQHNTQRHFGARWRLLMPPEGCNTSLNECLQPSKAHFATLRSSLKPLSSSAFEHSYRCVDVSCVCEAYSALVAGVNYSYSVVFRITHQLPTTSTGTGNGTIELTRGLQMKGVLVCSCIS